MDTAVTAVQIFFIVGFTAGGLALLFLPLAKYAQLPAQGWANDFKPWHVKMIGVLKVCAAMGMTATLFAPTLAMLTPLAAIGVALVMAGAIATHLRREEYPNIVGNLVYLGLALFVAYGTLDGFVV